MSYKELIEKIKPELEKVVDFLEGELSKIRGGSASISLVEDLTVDCFGQKMPLKSLASVTLQGSRQIVIQPWDKSYLESIEKSIHQSDTGLSPVVEKDLVRVNFPSLTEEFRKDLLKLISDKKEEARKTVRKWRDESWKEIQDKFREGEIGEDEKFKAKDELQDLVNEYNERIDKISERKINEIKE
jgi:ribosome recycling factor